MTTHRTLPPHLRNTLIFVIMTVARVPTTVQNNQDAVLEESTPTKPTIEHDDSLLLSSDSLPIFQAEPQNAYVVKSRPALLQCRAGNALRVYFKCNGAKNADSTQSEFVHPQTGVRIVEAEINITRDMVEEFFGNEMFKCECHAWSGRGSIKSQAAVVDVAFLKKQFEVTPVSTRVEIGHQMELRCVAPVGMPPPRIYWLRDTQPFQSDTKMIVSTEGHLLISQARPQDTGNYTCVAENIAAKRLSNPAQITVYVNGGWSQWSPWTECKCPGSTLPLGKMSTRTCTNPPPSNGGAVCVGSAVRRTKDCQQCPQVEPARWSAWSDWSKCNITCVKTRKRQCIPGIGQGRKMCNGKDTQTSSCVSEMCRSTELTQVKEANLESTQYDIILYVGVMVAIFVVLLVSYFLVRIYGKKDHHQSLYNMASNEYHPEFFPAADKKTLSLQPDLTQTVPPCYEYPSYTAPSTAVQTLVTRSISEHHYDVPHLASGSDIQMSPATSSTLESSSGKRSQLSGFTNNSDSTYEVATESVTFPITSLPTAYEVTPATNGNYTSATVTHAGAFLNLPESNVSLTIPEGAISRSRKQEIFLSILNEDCFRPKLAENLTQLSPVVSCGPNISLSKAVILKVPHCADLANSKGNWSFSVLQTDCSDSHWQTAVTLGHETINTVVFCQMDEDVAFLVSDCLSRFVLVGQSSNGTAAKKLKIAIFGPKLCLQTSVDYCVRVYVLEDTNSFMETVFGQEKRLGGYLLDNPKTITFYDGGNNLCLSIENISEGWKAKSSSTYQEITFKQLWQSTSNSPHCSFNLEAYETDRNLSFNIKINQTGFDHVHHFDVGCKEEVDVSKVKLYHNELVPKVTIQSETSRSYDSKKSVEFANSPKSAKSFKFNCTEDGSKMAKNFIVTDKGVSTCDDFTFRLSKQVRKQLCQCLDTPTHRGNDWRLLAHALHVDHYINFFATKSSPTDCILDLWEARHRNSNALSELRHIFKEMERFDAVNIMDTCLGQNWL